MLDLCSLTASGQELIQCCQGVIYPKEGSEGSGEQSYKLYYIGSMAHFDPESTHTTPTYEFGP